MRHEFDARDYEKASAHQKEWGAKLITSYEVLADDNHCKLGALGRLHRAQLKG